jgi:hypothetical protein
MRRKNPFLSLSGIIFMVVFMSGLGWSLWAKGGVAFNPGLLTELNRSGTTLGGFFSHADFEPDCSRCHQPLSSDQATLCLDCHASVKQEISSMDNLHGKISTGSSKIPIEHCYSCHSDHQGRDFSPAQAALDEFDHAITNFSLIRHQFNYDTSPMGCESCHDLPNEDLGDFHQECFACHAGDDHTFMTLHVDEFGLSCIECHDGADRMVNFGHDQTNFPLEGVHEQIRCSSCHTTSQNENRFTGISGRCSDCHLEPEVHAGLFSDDCQECHNPKAWSPALLEGSSFDHAEQVDFSLNRHQKNYDGSPLVCSGCHVSDLGSMSTRICIDCHRAHDALFMESHLAQFGANCMDCHDGSDRMSDFDHNRFFILDGKHAEIDCQACHGAPPEPVSFAGTPTTCVSCHAEPEIHAGVFGLECQNCHRTDAWSPALLQNHSFPLDHGEQGLVSCQVCHPTTYVEYTCYDCHEHDPQETLSEHLEEGISAEELPNCTSCHPTGLKDEAEGRGDD